MHPPLCCGKRTPKYGMDVSDITSQKEVKNSATSIISNFDTFLGCTETTFGALLKDRHNSEQCPL
jgi:hypothetical protein